MDRLIAKAKADMDKTVEVIRKDIAAYRTGRASPALVDNLEIEYYGTKVPLNQIGSIQVVDLRLLQITPWDKNALSAIEKAIMTSELGLMPTNDGNVIRLEIPSLTEERREELSRQVKKRLEDGRVAVRNTRRATNDAIDKMEKAEGLSEDEVRVGKEEVQDLTNEHVKMIDEIGEEKIKEILEL
ncbi:MAG: ribosome recycling factor [candidate division WS1 bacterium]|jgi:ribosome recycling factor|nr:ribosome recycling factor [candidate division WS1 bacterium]